MGPPIHNLIFYYASGSVGSILALSVAFLLVKHHKFGLPGGTTLVCGSILIALPALRNLNLGYDKEGGWHVTLETILGEVKEVRKELKEETKNLTGVIGDSQKKLAALEKAFGQTEKSMSALALKLDDASPKSMPAVILRHRGDDGLTPIVDRTSFVFDPEFRLGTLTMPKEANTLPAPMPAPDKPTLIIPQAAPDRSPASGSTAPPAETKKP